MRPEPFTPWEPGKSVSAEEMNRALDIVHKLSGFAGYGVNNQSGWTVIDPPPVERWWAKIGTYVTATDPQDPLIERRRYAWTRVRPDDRGGWTELVDDQGFTDHNWAYHANEDNNLTGQGVPEDTIAPLYWDPLLRNPIFFADIPGANNQPFLAVLVRKCYPAGEVGWAACGADSNCDGTGDPERFIQYSWIEVTDSGTEPGPPCPVTYSFGTRCGGPGCFPAYHMQNVDLPVYTPANTTTDCCDERTTTPSNNPITHAVYRLRPGRGDYYIIDQPVWQDIFRRTGTSDAAGEIAYLRYYDQAAGAWADGQEVRLVTAE